MAQYQRHQPCIHVNFVDIGNIRSAVYDNLDGLIETQLSNKDIGFDPTDALETLMRPDNTQTLYPRYYDKHLKRWLKLLALPPPQPESSERVSPYSLQLSGFLNNMGSRIVPLLENDNPSKRPSNRRAWVAVCFSNSQSATFLALMKWSDRTASPHDISQTRVLRQSLSIMDIKTDSTERQVCVEQLATKVHSIFAHQPDRRFILAASLVGHSMFVALFNRGGLYLSRSFNVHEDPTSFLRFSAGMVFANRDRLGYDPEMIFTHVDETSTGRYVVVNGKKYPILKLLHIECTIRGRATVCLQVRDCVDQSRELVVKSSWVPPACKRRREAIALRDLQGVKEVMVLEDVENVHIKSGEGKWVPYSTRVDFDCLRPWMSDRTWMEHDKLVANRMLEQVRLVISPLGSSLCRFRSLREIIGAFIDTVDAIQALYERGYCHCDISMGNIMFEDDGGKVASTKPERKAFLIDFDIAKKNSDEFVSDWKFGTFLFTSIDLLESEKPIRHEYFHDLESLYFLLIYIGCSFSGPNTKNPDFDIALSRLNAWTYKGASCSNINARLVSGNAKWVDMVLLGNFKRHIMSLLHPYFERVKDCLGGLRELIFGHYIADYEDEDDMRTIHPRKRDPTSYFNAFRAILRNTFDSLSEMPPSESFAAGELTTSGGSARGITPNRTSRLNVKPLAEESSVRDIPLKCSTPTGVDCVPDLRSFSASAKARNSKLPRRSDRIKAKSGSPVRRSMRIQTMIATIGSKGRADRKLPVVKVKGNRSQ